MSRVSHPEHACSCAASDRSQVTATWRESELSKLHETSLSACVSLKAKRYSTSTSPGTMQSRATHPSWHWNAAACKSSVLCKNTSWRFIHASDTQHSISWLAAFIGYVVSTELAWHGMDGLETGHIILRQPEPLMNFMNMRILVILRSQEHACEVTPSPSV